MSSKFREHLSLSLPSNHLDIPAETSRFSSTTTTVASSPVSLGRNNSKRSQSVPKDVEAGAGTSPTSSDLRDRFTRLFFDLRAINTAEPDLVPVQEPSLSQWQPLQVEKRRCTCEQPHDPKYDTRIRKQKRRSCCLLVVLIIVILLLIGNVAFLNVRVLSLTNTSSMTSTSQTTSTANALSVDAQQCLSQYVLNAPSSPAGYPCSTCLSTLRAVPSSYNETNTQNAQQINNAIQFCGLRAIYETANSQGQAILGNGSWVQNLNFCTWNGVSCDTSERVSSLQLTFPGVPATLPNEIGALTALQTLEVIGGNTIPAGSLPSSFNNLTALSTLRLESTSITALPNSLFSTPGLTQLSTLALVRNTQMGSTLPSSLTSLTGLQSLLVNSQPLSPSPLAAIAGSSSLAASLHTLDLTSTSLTGSIPSDISSMKGLTQLLLGSNNLTGPVPTFSSTLQVLELNGNSGLSGSIACAPSPLQQCSVQGTTISVAGCGVCQKNTTTPATTTTP